VNKWVNSITFRKNNCDDVSLQKYYLKAIKYTLLNVNCLERSVALFVLMKYYGFSSVLCIGVGKKVQTFHAWVVNDQIPELDESNCLDEYVIISKIKACNNL